MYQVKFKNETYTFPILADAEAFAAKCGAKAEYKSICGDPNCHCESVCKSFHYPSTIDHSPLTIGHEQEDYQLNN